MAEKLIDFLVREKVVTEEQAQSAQEIAGSRGTTPVQQLIAGGQLNESSLLEFFSNRFSIPAVKLTSITKAALRKIPIDLILELRCVPFHIEQDDSLRVAIADPMDLPNIEKLRSVVTQKIVPMLTTFTALHMALRRISEKAEVIAGNGGKSAKTSATGTLSTMVPPATPPKAEAPRVEIELDRPEPPKVDPPKAELPKKLRQTQPVVNIKRFSAQQSVTSILNEILTDGISKGASDIHVEPQPTQIRVRFRLEGTLFDVAQIAVELKDQITTRTKVISGLDISEHRVPQDGRTKLKVGDEEISFRVNVMPSLYGESTVFRLLRQGDLQLDVSQLGFNPEQLRIFRKGIEAPNGMVLVTGPTGSGKTTTLYSALSELNSPTVKITTVEDPVEYNLDGITQVPINKDTGLDFAEVLKGILRQDPDIILVGEIRDQETATVAVQAALTGHLVFSSLHTNDAPSAVLRLLNMGVEPFVVLAAVSTVVAQRLLRKVCPDCTKSVTVSEKQLEFLGADRHLVEKGKFMRGEGCDRCLGGGYRGRVAIFEVLELSDSMKEMILKGENLIAVKRRAIADGMKTLRQSALHLVGSGTTTLEEAIASTLER